MFCHHYEIGIGGKFVIWLKCVVSFFVNLHVKIESKSVFLILNIRSSDSTLFGTQSPIRNMSPTQLHSNTQASITSVKTYSSQQFESFASFGVQPLSHISTNWTVCRGNPGFQNSKLRQHVPGDHYECIDQGRPRDSYLEHMSHQENPRYLNVCFATAYVYSESDAPTSHYVTHTYIKLVPWYQRSVQTDTFVTYRLHVRYKI